MKILDLLKESNNYSTRWIKYFEVYDQIFEKFRDKKITFVEVGVLNGGSLEMWKKYFHPESRIIGIDLNPECKKFEKNGIEIFIGDQSDEKFWDNFFKQVGNIDILLDDGGHLSHQQIITTVKSIKNINDGGLLLVEDVHASYMENFNNIRKRTFIDFSKKLIDDVNKKNPLIKENLFKFSLNDYVHSIHFFESIVVINVDRKKTYENSKYKSKNPDNKMQDFRYNNTFSGKFIQFIKLRIIKTIIFKISIFFEKFLKLIKYNKYFK